MKFLRWFWARQALVNELERMYDEFDELKTVYAREVDRNMALDAVMGVLKAKVKWCEVTHKDVAYKDKRWYRQ